jgi:uncharacterized protein (TIGR02646 family)
MIHIDRLAAPGHLNQADVHQWTQMLCAMRRQYYADLAAYRRGKRSESPRRPEAESRHYAHPTVRVSLEAMFGTKCAYCETEVRASGRQQIEHYRPQSIYPALAYRWENLLLACSECNSFQKRHLFPVGRGGKTPTERRQSPCTRDDSDAALLLNPCDADPNSYPERHLTFEDGRVVLVRRSRRGRYTIDLCGLNRVPLVDDRREHLIEVQTRIERYLIACLENDTKEAHKQAMRLKHWCRDKAQYAGMARAELAREGIDWRAL